MDKERTGIRQMMSHTKSYLFVALFTVCLYSFFQNFDKISAVVQNFFRILEPLFWGMAIAFVVNMPMRFLEKRVFSRWKASAFKRCVCIALGFLFVLLIISMIMLMIVPRFLDSANIVIKYFDSYIVSLDTLSSELIERFNMTASDIKWLESVLQNIFDYIDDILGEVVPLALQITVSVATILIDLLFSLILGFYMLFNKEKHIEQAKNLTYAFFSEEKCEQILSVCSQTNQALNNYFFGMILECGILGGMCFVGMTIFGFPYALLISVVVGVTQIVPIIGPWVSAILGAIVILMTRPEMALWFLVFIIVVQQIECNLIYPRVVGNMVGLSGIWVMIAILLGSGLFGIPGIILSVPLMAVIQTLIRKWVDSRVVQKRGNEPKSSQQAEEIAIESQVQAPSVSESQMTSVPMAKPAASKKALRSNKRRKK